MADKKNAFDALVEKLGNHPVLYYELDDKLEFGPNEYLADTDKKYVVYTRGEIYDRFDHEGLEESIDILETLTWYGINRKPNIRDFINCVCFTIDPSDDHVVLIHDRYLGRYFKDKAMPRPYLTWLKKKHIADFKEASDIITEFNLS